MIKAFFARSWVALMMCVAIPPAHAKLTQYASEPLRQAHRLLVNLPPPIQAGQLVVSDDEDDEISVWIDGREYVIGNKVTFSRCGNTLRITSTEELAYLKAPSRVATKRTVLEFKLDPDGSPRSVRAYFLHGETDTTLLSDLVAYLIRTHVHGNFKLLLEYEDSCELQR